MIGVHQQRFPVGAVVGDVELRTVEDRGILGTEEVVEVERGQVARVVAGQAEGVGPQRPVPSAGQVVGLEHSGVVAYVIAGSRLILVGDVVGGGIQAEVEASAALDAVVVSAGTTVVESRFDAVSEVILSSLGPVPEVVIDVGEVQPGDVTHVQGDAGRAVGKEGQQLAVGVEGVEGAVGGGGEQCVGISPPLDIQWPGRQAGEVDPHQVVCRAGDVESPSPGIDRLSHGVDGLLPSTGIVNRSFRRMEAIVGIVYDLIQTAPVADGVHHTVDEGDSGDVSAGARAARSDGRGAIDGNCTFQAEAIAVPDGSDAEWDAE